MATPLAQAAYEKMYETLGGKPAHCTLAFHWARLVEAQYAAERMKQLLEDPEIASTDLRTIPTETPAEGVGIVEAPRGTLIHHYSSDDDGILTKVNLIVATNFNAAPIEEELLKVAENEQLRIGRDLHDGLVQHLVGLSALAELLTEKTKSRSPAEHDLAAKMEALIEQAVEQARTVARGLHPLELRNGEVVEALEELAVATGDLHSLQCQCHYDEDARVADINQATHLYRIAQEAVNNAVRHGRPTHISIDVSRKRGRLMLVVEDDGAGLPPGMSVGKLDDGMLAQTGGMGLRTMTYRAQALRGTLAIERVPTGGTRVSCVVPGGP